MKSTALFVRVCGALVILVVAGCDGSGDGKSKVDGGGTEAGNPGDVAPGRDTNLPGADVRDSLLPVDARRTDTPTTDAPSVPPPVDGPMVVVDGARADTVVDAPIGSESEAGSAPGLDGPAGEAGSLPPLVYPDGGLTCGLAGAVCQSAADCCGLACVSNRCATAACVSDGTACTSNGECCSTVCGPAGTCLPLNPLCKTAGNACNLGSECCSGSCNASGQCAMPGQVSYCSQVGDICRADSECCTGVCNAASGAAAGTCATIVTSCQIDGTVCAGCGSCCSHFCGPFGMGGPDICQPASGCRVQGDLCRKDTDCCGGDVTSGLPGAGLVKCELDPVYGSRIGTCGGPKASNCSGGAETCKNSCNPEGNVCHYTDTAICEGATTSKRADCCACISGKECCKLDRTGIPRCNALTACVPAGGNCAFADECCDHLPCVPDPTTGKLTCGSTCVPRDGACTTNADCCTGMLCAVTPGSLAGVCTIPTQPPVVEPDGGVIEPDSGVTDPDASEPDLPPPPVCAFYGQACSLTVACCGGIACVNEAFFDCTAADPFCFCFSPE